MAKTKVNEAPNENEIQDQVRPIKIRSKTDPDVIYVLEFSRYTVKLAEDSGFKIEELIGSKEGSDDDISLKVGMKSMEKLFHFAFLMHQPGMKPTQTSRILHEELKGLTPPMISRLIELYMITFNTLVQTEESFEKNSTMTVEL